LLVLFALFFFGGEAVRGFSLGLIIGVLIGTYSSLYIVTTILISLNLSQEDMAVLMLRVQNLMICPKFPFLNLIQQPEVLV